MLGESQYANIFSTLLVVESQLRTCNPCFVLDPRPTARCARKESRHNVHEKNILKSYWSTELKIDPKRRPSRCHVTHIVGMGEAYILVNYWRDINPVLPPSGL